MSRIAILGAGAWGLALAIHAARGGADVILSARDPAAVGRRLPGFALPERVRVTGTPPGAADAVLVAVPTQALRAALAGFTPAGPLVLCCKGIEAGTGCLPLEIAASVHPATQAAVLTGPNFAHEVAAGLPAASVIAAADADVRRALVRLLSGPAFRLYGNEDPVGAQLGGAAKNVIAIAAGAVTGAGYGENARAALITRGLAELARLIVAQGGRAETASGLSGLGDLVLTCTGAGSRNFAHGVALGRGVAPVAATVEGVATAPALIARATGVDLPICQAVARVLAGEISLEAALVGLMTRPSKEEGLLF
jgi:glycerol-3-phosphate dehydrogenase (NAD(P)+)